MKKNDVQMRLAQSEINSLFDHANKQIVEAILFLGILRESEEVTDMLRIEKNNIISAFSFKLKKLNVDDNEITEYANKLRRKFRDVSIPRYKQFCVDKGIDYHSSESQSRWINEGYEYVVKKD